MAFIRIPDNGPGVIIFQESYYDELHGTLHKRGVLMRDYENRVRRMDDIDELGRDELRLEHRTRTERPIDPVR